MLFELGLDGVSDVLAYGIEVSGRILLARDKLVLEDGLDELSGL